MKKTTNHILTSQQPDDSSNVALVPKRGDIVLQLLQRILTSREGWEDAVGFNLYAVGLYIYIYPGGPMAIAIATPMVVLGVE